MRASDARSGSLFSYVDLEERLSTKHPRLVIKAIVDDALSSLDAEFERLYEPTGRESVAPERLLTAAMLQAFFSVRSERQLMEQIDDNLRFRWFVGLGIDDRVWDHSTFMKIRMVERQSPSLTRLITLGADKGYGAASFVDDLKQIAPPQRHRRRHNTACTLCGQPAREESDRGGLRLGKDHRRPRQDEGARDEARRLQVHLHDGSLRSDPDA